MSGNGREVEVEAVLRQALELGEDERWDEMATLLSETLDETEDDDPVLLCWLGVAESELGNDGAAYEAFRRCLDQQPTDPHVLALAGAGLAEFDDPDAETALRAAALSAPDLLMARLNYGAYLSRAGLYDEAFEQLRAARDIAPEDPIVRGELGAAYILKGDREGGAAELEEALTLAPDDSWTRVLHGLVLLELDRVEQGAEELVTAARERDDDPEAMALGALAAAVAGWQDAAEELLARAEYAVEGTDVKMLEEVETAIRGGEESARRMLRGTIGPSALRERLGQPL